MKFCGPQSLTSPTMRREDRGAGPIAAAYLHEFIEDGTQWVHLDVVGPAVQRKSGKHLAKGATGVCMAGVCRFLAQE